MSAESSLRFRRAPVRHIAAWILLAGLLAALALLAFAVLVGLTNPDPSLASEPVLMGPFRWIQEPPSG